jgi:uncharacterized protein YggE
MTMTMRLAVLFLALLPIGASAQGPAPLVSRSSPAGISVVGHGSVRVPVKTLQFVAATRGNADEPAVLAAMRAAGVVDPVVGPAGSVLSNNQVTMLRGTIPDASPAKLEHIGLAAADYVRKHPGTSIDNVNFFPRLDDCNASEQSARTAAFADARRRSEAIASLAGLTIVGVQAVNETGGCPAPADLPQLGPGVPFDLATLTATVSVYDNITFEVTPAVNGARRRPL